MVIGGHRKTGGVDVGNVEWLMIWQLFILVLCLDWSLGILVKLDGSASMIAR